MSDSSDIAKATLLELRRLRVLLTIGVFIALVVALFFAKDMVLPLVLGVLMALTLSPVVRAGQRIGLPAPASAGLVIASLAIAVAVGGYTMSGPIGTWMERAPQMGAELQEKLEGIFASVEKVKEASDQVEEIAQQAGSADVQRVAVEQPGLLNSAANLAAGIGTTVSVALVMALFILSSGDLFYAKLVESYPRLSEKKRALRIVYGVERAISSYLLTITIVNAGLGLVVWILMMAAGLPNAFVWGVLAFAFNYLPFIGAVAGLVLVSIYALVSIEPIGQAILAPALYLLATMIEGQFVTPTILGRRLKLNTVSVFVTVVFWGWLWGVAGALMAVPFLVIVKVICDNIDGLRTLGNFLGGADTQVAAAKEPRAQAEGASDPIPAPV